MNKANPYISRGPVRDPAMFYGRKHELEELVAFLRGNQSVSLIGPRKIGKTSLLFHIMRPEIGNRLGLGEETLVVYLNCEILADITQEDVFSQFASEIATSLEERNAPPEPLLEAVLNKPSRLTFEAAVRKLNRRGLQIVILLDEFERLSTNTRLDANFFNGLRSAAGRYQLVFVTASASPLIELTYAERAQSILSSPFFNIFAPLFLGLLSNVEVRQLITEPAERAGSPFDAETADMISDLAGGHPFALQIACFHAFERSGAYAQIEQRALSELESHFQYYWRNLTPLEQDVLRHLAEAGARAPDDTNLRGALRDLMRKCLAVSHSGAYHYPSRAWEAFVAAQKTATPTDELAFTPIVVRQEAQPDSLIGAWIGPYNVIELIGRGGMAEVYKGWHAQLEREVAIKMLPAILANDSRFRQRFEREARSIAALKHPNIVQVFDFGEAYGGVYMVMEYISGRDLGKLLKDNGSFPLSQALWIVHDIADALDYAHAAGVIHRDVKPSNVLLEPVTSAGERMWRGVLTDFGIARILNSPTQVTQTGAMIGTLDYMAPEQINASPHVDGRADIYAIGVMLFQMLTGALPFDGETPAMVMVSHLNQEPPDPRGLVPDLPDAVASAILRALAKDPAARFAAVRALVDALAQ